MELNDCTFFNNDKVRAGYTADCGGRFIISEPDAVDNYRAVSEALGYPVKKMIKLKQKHTDRVIKVDAPDGGLGILHDIEQDPCDAVITDAEDLVLSIITADCVPVFLYDEDHHAIGLAHSGRAGVYSEISAKTVICMHKEYGTDPASVRCVLGPYICQEHYELDITDTDPLMDIFTGEEYDRCVIIKRTKAYLDMGAAITISL